MLRKLDTDLIAIDILTIILGISIAYVPIDTIRIILGIPFVLFFPGYTLISALFPSKASQSGVERIAFGFGLSMAVVPLIGLVLNYTPWGINIYPVLISLVIFILAISIIAMIRRNRLIDEDRFRVSFKIDYPGCLSSGWLNKSLTVLMAIAILSVIGAIAYVISTPKIGEKLTEFYILGPDGKAEGYPRKIRSGESASVIVGIVNHEQETMAYRLVINIDNIQSIYNGSIVLSKEELWEQTVKVTPTLAGDNQKVEFYLYKGVSHQPYTALRLWLDVVK